ncbi:MAG: T9SS type A sorting domain-containing protein [Flavobacteriales bacterium]|nr:T9SS type A sorting domain-containing protein [Flavobacteriales bacterium]
MMHMNTKKNLVVALALGLVAPASIAQDCDLMATAVVTNATCGSNDGSINITVSGGQAPYYFTWSTGATTEDISGVGAGSYWVNVEDYNKCLYKLDVIVGCDEPKDCNFRTQTQGGWGAKPSGNNPAKYLQNHWASCFPNGITIGCASGNTLTLTSSTAVKDFLPSGSTPSQLPSDMVNPGGSYSNVLAGQLVAAVINVTVDACDPNFSPSSEWVGNAWFTNGPLAGYGVWDVIYLANQYIGGCGGSFTASQLNDALTMFNENYDNGTTNNGNLDCGKKEEEKSMFIGTALDRVVLYPNPVNETLTIDLTAATRGATEVMVTDLAGRVVIPTTLIATEAGENQRRELNVSILTDGTYLMVVRRDGVPTTRTFVVAH